MMCILTIERFGAYGHTRRSRVRDMQITFSRFSHNVLKVVLATTIILSLSLLPAKGANDKSLKLLTGHYTSSYYPVGVALSTLFQLKQTPEKTVLLEAGVSGGTRQNIEALISGKADIAFVDGATLVAALNNRPPFNDVNIQSTIKILLPVWQDIAHFVVRERDALSDDLDDFRNLHGKAVSFGPKGSHSEQAASHFFTTRGIYHDQLFQMVDYDHASMASAFAAQRLDGFAAFTNLGDARIEEVLVDPENEAVLLSVSDDLLRRLNTENIPVWTRHVVPARTYSNQSRDVRTVAQPNFLVVRADFAEDDAYYMAKTIAENLSFLKTLHGAPRTIDFSTLLENTVLPLHVGAERYFVETLACDALFCLFD